MHGSSSAPTLYASAVPFVGLVASKNKHLIRIVPYKMLEKGKGVLGRSLRLEIEDMWSPLREIQAEDAVVKRANEESIKGITYAK